MQLEYIANYLHDIVLVELPALTMVSFLGNPIIHHRNYRLYVIYKLTHLRTLDFKKIKKQERAAAVAFFTTEKGVKLKETVASNPVRAPVAVTGLTADQRKKVQVCMNIYIVSLTRN